MTYTWALTFLWNFSLPAVISNDFQAKIRKLNNPVILAFVFIFQYNNWISYNVMQNTC